MSITAPRLCLLLAWLLAASPALAEWHADTQSIMGTRVHAELWLDDPSRAEQLLDAVMAEMRRIDATYSPYLESSDLSVLNREAPRGWVKVTAEMFELLSRSRRVSELTDGAFDVTYASVGRYYDYREGKRPDNAQIREAVEAIDYRYVELDPDGLRVRYAHPGVYVDLGGIAKGYAVDRAAAVLRRAGIEQAGVSAGGDSYIIGDRRGEPWTVGIRDPRKEDAMAAVLPLMDTAVSTSGDYERFFEEDGVRYHHILDPATGRSARESWSVTILGPDATFTDALSTSVFVLGPDRGLELIDRLPGIDAIVIDAAGRLRYSAELAPLDDGDAP
jgi:thiamine biosynthesis lipoprotein